MNESDIKTLTPIECPHCKNVIVTEFVSSAPTFNGAYTAEDIENAKKDARDEILKLGLSAEEIQPYLDWLDHEETVFGPGDVPTIINGIKEGDENVTS